MRLIAIAVLCLLTLPAHAQIGDDRPSWGNRMQGHQPAREWRWASWYDCRGKGQCSRSKRTASGERFNPAGLTFAHKSMRFGARVRFTHGRRSAVCVCSDRGPFIRGRDYDLSAGCARAIGMTGVARIGVERI